MQRILLASVVFLFVAAAHAEQALETRGKIDAVTVYRGQALVTRLIDIPGPAGLREVVVTELPDQVLPGSIYAESANGVEVRSVSYRVRPVEKDVREEVRKFDEQIRALQDKLSASQRRVSLLGEQRQYLEKLEQFTAPTVSVEMTKGVLNADTVEKITKFQFAKRAEMAEEEMRLALEQRALAEEIQTLGRKRSQIATTSSRVAREAMVFVNLTGNGGKLRVRYLVSNASWAPSYNIRASAGKEGVIVEYLASVQQLSGEDWTEVAMTLSTAMPSLVAKAPALGELNIALIVPGRERSEEMQKWLNKDYKTAKQELSISQYAIQGNRGLNWNGIDNNAQPQAGVSNSANALTLSGINSYTGATTISSGTLMIGGDDQLNDTAGQQQLLDVLTKEKITRGKDQRPSPSDIQEGLAVSYSLANRTSLPSRSDRQLIQIVSLPLSAEKYKVASPVLSSFVYDEALVTNTSQTVLLAGPVSTYVDSQFVGQGFVPTVAVGENFTAGLGIDSSLRAGRELVEKTETTQGGNRVVDFTYRMAIDNFGSKAVKVRILDRHPIAKDGEIKVTMLNPGKDLSKDPSYEPKQHKKGILRWDVDVPAQAVGAKAFSFEYQFRLEYDKQMFVGGMPSPSMKK